MNESRTQIELISDSPEQTQAMGRALAGRLAGGHVVALVGHLGAGKTQWVKGLAAGLGIEADSVHSPTFTIINEYSCFAAGPTCPVRARRVGKVRADLLLYHVDAYRLNSAAELDAIGFSEMVAAADGLVAVEWADRVASLIPPSAVWIEGSMPSHLADHQRRYVIRAADASVLDWLKADC